MHIDCSSYLVKALLSRTYIIITLRSLSEGGTPAKFLIIDDGWQDTVNKFQKEGEPYVEGSQ